MRFVLGRPAKGCDPCWYVRLDCREAEVFVAAILRDNSANFARDPHKGAISAICAIASMQLAMQIDLGFHDRHGYYVGRKGGMCPKLFEIIEEREIDTWPDGPRIETFRWPNGKHYYAKVDGTDVEYKGQTKWNTHEAAQSAAEAFVKYKGAR